jgi:uncharacterized protein YbjT (DUF2867 family)
MERDDKLILVTGATGHQGGAAARHLIRDGWKVRALTRDPNKAEAHSLAILGAEIVQVDLLDRSAVDAAMQGVWGVYLMGTPSEGGPKAEEKMGCDVIDAAKDTGVQHLVYSSVLGADHPSTEIWAQAKSVVEQYVHDSLVPFSILRPTFFMENEMWHKDEILAGKLTGPDWPESMHPMIAIDDIGRFAALAFAAPETFLGATMTIAGDCMTFAEMAETLSAELGIPISYEHAEQPEMSSQPHPAPGVAQYPDVDVEECRRLIPDLATFAKWIDATGWKALAGVSRR